MSSSVSASPTSASQATPSQARTFEVRHLQIARALFAALAAIMITFSPDHSETIGLTVFSGWAIATALVFFVAVWQVYSAGERVIPLLLGIVTLVAGMIAGTPNIRSVTLFFVLVIAWAVVSGLIELVSGIRRRRTDDNARDAMLIGAITLALALGLVLVNPAYSLEYFIAEAGQSYVLTGITIGVGLFGGYAAIIAVFLAIAGFSPRRTVAEPAAADAEPVADSAGESA